MQHWKWEEHKYYFSVELLNPPVNAVSAKTLRELEKILERIESQTAVKLVIFSGQVITPRGNACFCAGADLKEREEWDEAAIIAHTRWQRSIIQRILKLSHITLTLVDGRAIGFGAELCLASHYVIATKSSCFSFPEAKHGLIPGAGGTAHLLTTKNRRLLAAMLTAERMTAEKAMHLNLVQELVADAAALEQAAAPWLDAVKNQSQSALRALIQLYANPIPEQAWEAEAKSYEALVMAGSFSPILP